MPETPPKIIDPVPPDFDKGEGTEQSVSESTDNDNIKDYDIEIKKAICNLLYSNSDLLDSNRLNSEFERIQRRKIGFWVATIAATVPVIVLLILFGMIFCYPQRFFGGMGSSIPAAIFISASFLSFIVIYTVLIKGMFQSSPKSSPKDDSSSSSEEALRILREIRPE